MTTTDTRERLVVTAGEIFSEKGFDETTVREICTAAGANVAAVNYYFGDKQQLYLETVRRAHQRRAGQVPLPGAESSTGHPADRLAELTETLLTRMLGTSAAPWETRLMMREVLQPTAACREMVEDYFRPLFDRFLEVLDEVLPDDTPRHRRHQVAFSIVGQCLLYRTSGEVVALLVGDDERAAHYSVAQLADHISQFTLSALGLAGSPIAEQPMGSEPA